MATKTKSARNVCQRSRASRSNTATRIPHAWTAEQTRAIEIAMVAFAALLIVVAVMGA